MLWDEEKMRDGETVFHGEGRRVENASCGRRWNILAPIHKSYRSAYRICRAGLTSKGEGTVRMPGIRVLVVEDSVVIRKVLCEVLASDQAIEGAGSTADGSIALAKIPQLNPDLITPDVEMPVMSGLETRAEIRKIYPRLPVIMFSTLTECVGSITLDALALEQVTMSGSRQMREALSKRARAARFPCLHHRRRSLAHAFRLHHQRRRRLLQLSAPQD